MSTLKNQYGDLNDEATYKKYAADIFSKTMIFDDARWNAFVANPDANILQDDPAFQLCQRFLSKIIYSKYASYYPAIHCKEC